MCFQFIADACINEKVDAEFDIKIKLDVNPLIIKEQVDDASFVVKIEPVVNPFLIEVDGVNEVLIANNENLIIGSNDSME